MNKRVFLAAVLAWIGLFAVAQTDNRQQDAFCKSFYKVLELGRHDNFDSYDGTTVKQSPFLQVPGYSIYLERFPVNYADKDHRFVAKTNENLDSLSALNKLEELKLFVGHCLDSTYWSPWSAKEGDDSTTVFIKELKIATSSTRDFTVQLAIAHASAKIYTINLYIRRRR